MIKLKQNKVILRIFFFKTQNISIAHLIAATLAVKQSKREIKDLEDSVDYVCKSTSLDIVAPHTKYCCCNKALHSPKWGPGKVCKVYQAVIVWQRKGMGVYSRKQVTTGCEGAGASLLWESVQPPPVGGLRTHSQPVDRLSYGLDFTCI